MYMMNSEVFNGSITVEDDTDVQIFNPVMERWGLGK